MKQDFEKIAQEAFTDELEKISAKFNLKATMGAAKSAVKSATGKGKEFIAKHKTEAKIGSAATAGVAGGFGLGRYSKKSA
jgi:hypothetical protein